MSTTVLSIMLMLFFSVYSQTLNPTLEPTYIPTSNPTILPTTHQPTLIPTIEPTNMPSLEPTMKPSEAPTECNGYSKCWGKIIANKSELTCNGQYSCSYSTFICAESSICHIECGSELSGYSCSDMIIDGRNAKSLIITSNDIDSIYDLQNTKIFCPINSDIESCIIYYAAANREESDFINTKFFAVNGIKDISLIGNDDGLTSILRYNISIYFGYQYQDECTIKRFNNSLICINHLSNTTSDSDNNIFNTTASNISYSASDISNHQYFCRGYNLMYDDIVGSDVINCNDNNNIDTYSDRIKSCSYSSLTFSTAYSSYTSYSETDSESISASFSSEDNKAAGSLSYSRTQTATTVKNSQSYIYRMDFSCVEGDISLPSYSKVSWDDDFLNDMTGLPTDFSYNNMNNYDENSYNLFYEFWGKYGTHIIQSAKLGGRVHGSVITDACSVNKEFTTSRSYTVCLNAEFSDQEASECVKNNKTNVEGASAAYYVSQTTLSVKGGDSKTFGDIINNFNDPDKEESYNKWIDSLALSPYITGGNLQEMYSVIKDVVNSNIGMDTVHGMNKYLDDKTLLEIANSMENAYYLYINKSLSTEANIQCDFSCGTGKLNKRTCSCDNCNGVNCCDDADNAVFYNMYIHCIVIVFVLLIY